jgi:DNA (cytosine-5)-methyltransferase 3A
LLKFLIGGSPCTHWSIAQSNNREKEPQGLGWELFRNFLIAKERFKPDFFLYENNKSAAKPIKEQISRSESPNRADGE